MGYKKGTRNRNRQRKRGKMSVAKRNRDRKKREESGCLAEKVTPQSKQLSPVRCILFAKHNMGRPKKSDLFCPTCNQAFLKKIDLQIHMESHSDSNEDKNLSDERQARVRSNWCAACKKSFEDNEYKLHIQTEHQLDFNKAITGDDDDNEHLPFENGYIRLSRKRIKKEPETENRILLSDIKIEPMSEEEEESCSSLTKKTVQKVKRVWFITCPDCGLKFKGPRGLRQHKMIMHKGKQKSSNAESEECVDNPPEIEINYADTNNYSPTTSANISAINIDQNLSGLSSYNMCLSNNIASANNQTDIQTPTICGNEQTKLLGIIPNFDCESEEYAKWLKSFIRICKHQEIPLPQFLCDNLNHIQDQIASALSEPSGSLKKKACHFYFMKMHNILTKILLDHMRCKLSIAGK